MWTSSGALGLDRSFLFFSGSESGSMLIVRRGRRAFAVDDGWLEVVRSVVIEGVAYNVPFFKLVKYLVQEE